MWHVPNWIPVLLLACLCVGSGCDRGAEVDERGLWYPTEAFVGSDASSARDRARPQMEATALDGDTASLRDVTGPTLVNLWATWCAPCKAEMPLLGEIHDEWSDRGLRMIGLSVEGEEARETIETYVETNEMPFEVWFAPRREPLSTFGASAVPATFLYDGGGRLVWSHDGRIEREDLKDLERSVRAVVDG